MSYTTNSCYDCCLTYPQYNCIYTPYNDPTFYETLASSGSLSLGTSAGTDRSISAEFGGSTPHALSEYYSCASGIPSSGTIDFSDFHGKSAGCNPPVTNCLWTHYDFSGCSVGTLGSACTTSAAAEQQCLDAGYLGVSPNGKTWTSANAQICTLSSNGVNNNYWLACNYCQFKTCDGDAFWGTGTSANTTANNSVFLVFKMNGGASCYGWAFVRWNSGYKGYVADHASYDYYRPWYSGYTWQPHCHQCRTHLYMSFFGSDSSYYGAYVYGCSATTQIQWCDSMIWSHRISTGVDWSTSEVDDSNFEFRFINDCQAVANPWVNSTFWGNNSNCYYTRIVAPNAGGFDFFNGGYSAYCINCVSSRTSECFAIGEYLHYKCKLTDTEFVDTHTYLKNKWSITGGTGTC